MGGQRGDFWCVGYGVGDAGLARPRGDHRPRRHPLAGLVGFKTRKHSWVMSHPYINDPKYWRERAEEVRSIAKLLNDQEAKRQLLAIASRYERLADHIKQRPKST